MKVFLSHARKDSAAARQLAKQLVQRGFSVWLPEDEIEPGDNWAMKMGKALDQADLMVFLLTPNALEADRIHQDIEFALGSREFENRVFTVLVGPTRQIGKDLPWILLKLPHHQVESARELNEAADEIEQFCADLSRPNA